ncbi:hypothetical protein EYC80_006826 [Monilinia laxa]|uniref:Uncharacterized protein n=1 Tax=Monilinia laxa TaxID=61186 RepID=A0A5N6JZ95_MONLA|nr:hypothetical protein EYC80_006826 [Monilinia laxa]
MPLISFMAKQITSQKKIEDLRMWYINLRRLLLVTSEVLSSAMEKAVPVLEAITIICNHEVHTNTKNTLFQMSIQPSYHTLFGHLNLLTLYHEAP